MASSRVKESRADSTSTLGADGRENSAMRAGTGLGVREEAILRRKLLRVLQGGASLHRLCVLQDASGQRSTEKFADETGVDDGGTLSTPATTTIRV